MSHPDRVVFPELGVTKLALAEYYDSVGDHILPHVAGRPLTLLHCPQGIERPCAFLKHAKAWGPTALRRVRIQEKTKVGEYLVADSISAVVALAQMGVVEIHTWNSTTDRLEQPDRIVWDLDPGPRVGWTAVAAAARALRDVLRAFGLRSWVKTTGGRGLHVVVPLRPSLDWSECLSFARAVSELLAAADPTYTTVFAKKGREQKILIDYLRNNRTNTSVAAYSVRARPGAPVSMPLAWNELTSRAPSWSVVNTQRRLRRKGDPWSEYWDTPQRISKDARKMIGHVTAGIVRGVRL